MSLETIKVGIMGCASIAERMVIPAILQTEGLELRAIASRDGEKARRFTEKFGGEPLSSYEALVARTDIDLVYMPLPTGLHLEWAVPLLESGKHVLLEKSLAVNLSEAIAIVDAAKNSGRLVRENFMFAHHRQMHWIREQLQSGRLGAVRCVRASFGFPPFPDANNIRYQPALGGGALLDAGAYTLKVATELFGHEVKLLHAQLNVDARMGVDLHGGLFLSGPDGIVIETAFGFDHFYQCSLEIWGTKGRLVAERIFTAGPGVQPKIRMEEAGQQEVIEIEADNHFRNLLSDLVQTIRNGHFEPDYQAIVRQATLLEESRRLAHIHTLS
jgi:hypothetical protein